MFARLAHRAATHLHSAPSAPLPSLPAMALDTLDIVIPPPPRRHFASSTHPMSNALASFDGLRIPPRVSLGSRALSTAVPDRPPPPRQQKRQGATTTSSSCAVSIPTPSTHHTDSSLHMHCKIAVPIQPASKLQHLSIDSSIYDHNTKHRQRTHSCPTLSRPRTAYPSSYQPTHSLPGIPDLGLPETNPATPPPPPIANVRDWRIRLNHLRRVLATALTLSSRCKRRRLNRQAPWTGPTLPPRQPHAHSVPHLRLALVAHLALLSASASADTIPTHLLLPHDHSAIMHAHFLLGNHRTVLALFHAHAAPDVPAFNLALQATAHLHGHVAAVRVFSSWMSYQAHPERGEEKEEEEKEEEEEEEQADAGQRGCLDAVSVATVMRVLEALGSVDEAVRVFWFACAKGVEDMGSIESGNRGGTQMRRKRGVARPPYVVPDAYLRQYARSLEERVIRERGRLATKSEQATEGG